MFSFGRRHFVMDWGLDLTRWGMLDHGVFQGKSGPIHTRRFGRIVWMTLPRGKRAN